MLADSRLARVILRGELRTGRRSFWIDDWAGDSIHASANVYGRVRFKPPLSVHWSVKYV